MGADLGAAGGEAGGAVKRRGAEEVQTVGGGGGRDGGMPRTTLVRCLSADEEAQVGGLQ